MKLTHIKTEIEENTFQSNLSNSNSTKNLELNIHGSTKIPNNLDSNQAEIIVISVLSLGDKDTIFSYNLKIRSKILVTSENGNLTKKEILEESQKAGLKIISRIANETLKINGINDIEIPDSISKEQ